MEIRIQQNNFQLLPEKALYWKEQNCLLLADLHIGKIAHFRQAGIAIPRSGISKNFEKLDTLIHAWKPDKIIFLGDLFHSRINEEWTMFCEWRDKFPGTGMEIVLGNHDRLPDASYHCANLKIHREFLGIGQFMLAHHPQRPEEGFSYVLSGHIHPSVHLTGMARQSVRLPCFYFGEEYGVLPSFGYFTGGHSIVTGENDQVIAIVEDQLIRVK